MLSVISCLWKSCQVNLEIQNGLFGDNGTSAGGFVCCNNRLIRFSKSCYGMFGNIREQVGKCFANVIGYSHPGR